MDHTVESGDPQLHVDTEASGDLARTTITVRLEPGQTLRIVKFLSYGWSSSRSMPALRDQVQAALAAARRTGFEGLLDEQRLYLSSFWEHADVVVKGDPELQQAVRFALFHVLQAGARTERRPIPAKGLTGPGYDGHSFWDTETFVLPTLTFTAPDAVRDVLSWRYDTLDLARARAVTLGLCGAAFPWRTISGEECSGYWPAGTAAFHVNADIADAVQRYLAATGDTGFEQDVGLDLLVETARLWRSLGHFDLPGQFRIDGVTGPDEYSAVVDNNVYTNLVARRNLLAAAECVARHPVLAARLGVDAQESASWRAAANAMRIPYDAALGVHPQAEGFTSHESWDFERTDPGDYPLLLHFPYFDIYRKQVIKQADLTLALHLCGDHFTPDEKRRNFDYYESRTVRDSSLSACTQAVVAAEVGHMSLAYDYAAEAALMDLRDLEHNTRDGLHIASLSGAWIALVQGFGGMRDFAGQLTFAPRLPQGLDSIEFRVRWQGRVVKVSFTHTRATYQLLAGDPLKVSHHAKAFTLKAEPRTLAIPKLAVVRPPTQPAGRAPRRRQRPDRS